MRDILGVQSPSIEQLSRKHGVKRKTIAQQVKKGTAVEYEHAKDKQIASEIARDHVKELPDYYDRLKKMEDK